MIQAIIVRLLEKEGNPMLQALRKILRRYFSFSRPNFKTNNSNQKPQQSSTTPLFKHKNKNTHIRPYLRLSFHTISSQMTKR